MLWFQVTGCSSNVPHTKKSTRLHIFSSTLHFTSENTNLSSHHNEIQWSTDDKTEGRKRGDLAQVFLFKPSWTIFLRLLRWGEDNFPPFRILFTLRPFSLYCGVVGKEGNGRTGHTGPFSPKHVFVNKQLFPFFCPEGDYGTVNRVSNLLARWTKQMNLSPSKYTHPISSIYPEFKTRIGVYLFRTADYSHLGVC